MANGGKTWSGMAETEAERRLISFPQWTSRFLPPLSPFGPEGGRRKRRRRNVPRLSAGASAKNVCIALRILLTRWAAPLGDCDKCDHNSPGPRGLGRCSAHATASNRTLSPPGEPPAAFPARRSRAKPGVCGGRRRILGEIVLEAEDRSMVVGDAPAEDGSRKGLSNPADLADALVGAARRGATLPPSRGVSPRAGGGCAARNCARSCAGAAA